jgi:hypothetical protein
VKSVGYGPADLCRNHTDGSALASVHPFIPVRVDQDSCDGAGSIVMPAHAGILVVVSAKTVVDGGIRRHVEVAGADGSTSTSVGIGP